MMGELIGAIFPTVAMHGDTVTRLLIQNYKQVLDDATPKQIGAMAAHVIGNTGQSSPAIATAQPPRRTLPYISFSFMCPA
jgi:hypothetical protein